MYHATIVKVVDEDTFEVEWSDGDKEDTATVYVCSRVLF